MTTTIQGASDRQALIGSLEKLLNTEVDPGRVKADADSLAQYGCDWTRFYQPAPLAIAFPKTTAQVQAIVEFARQHQLALVPSGGRTGLSGAAVATQGELVVSFELMNRILDFNPIDRTVRCQAGVVTEQLQQYAEEQGLFYPVDFASSGSSQLGGNLSTNAGGIKVIRYGMTRDWVAGLTAVAGTGDLLHCNHDLVKNATGYDLRHLFIGAEGTLGLITEVTMKLIRPAKNLQVLVLGVPELGAIMSVLHAFQQRLDLTAFEFFSDKAVQLVTARGEVQRPFESATAYYALLEFDGETEQHVETAMELFEHCLEQGYVEDGVISQSQAQAQALWRLREDISETIAEFIPYKNDISVVVSQVPEFLQAIDNLVAREYPDFEIVWFGHIGDGNLHLNILKPENLDKAAFVEKCQQVNRQVFEIVAQFNGSVSAEHGVGLTKKPYLQYSRPAHEIALMKQLKQVFDPQGIMNPGKIFDLDEPAGDVG